jgi:hypothetical protein
VLKMNSAEITAEECILIKEYCTNVDMYILKLPLKTNFIGSDYSNELLHNVVQREKAKKKSRPTHYKLYWIMVRM